MSYKRLWIEMYFSRGQRYRVNGERTDGSIRTGLARTNTHLAAQAEMAILARKHGLTYRVSPISLYHDAVKE
jgi:hypothetical protein